MSLTPFATPRCVRSCPRSFTVSTLFKRCPPEFSVTLSCSRVSLTSVGLQTSTCRPLRLSREQYCETSMFLPRVTYSRLLAPSIVVVAVLTSIQLAEAKSIRSLGFYNFRTGDAIKMRRGGCAAFGHSCFGGHGKRSEVAMNPNEGGEEAPSGLQPPADDVRAFLVSEGSRTPFEIFTREQPDNDLNLIAPSQYQFEDYVKLSPLFRKWVPNNYRRGELIAGNQ